VVDDAEGHAIIASPELERKIYVGHGITTSVEDKHITYACARKNCWSPPQPTCEHNWSRGKVHDIAYLGGHSVFYVELPSGKVVQSFVANAERRARPTWGDEVYVWWEDDSGVVLPHEAQRAASWWRAAPGDRRAVHLAVPVLHAAVLHRAEDQLRRSRRGDPAVHRDLHLR
jgi:hypothetical protein